MNDYRLHTSHYYIFKGSTVKLNYSCYINIHIPSNLHYILVIQNSMGNIKIICNMEKRNCTHHKINLFLRIILVQFSMNSVEIVMLCIVLYHVHYYVTSSIFLCGMKFPPVFLFITQWISEAPELITREANRQGSRG